MKRCTMKRDLDLKLKSLRSAVGKLKRDSAQADREELAGDLDYMARQIVPIEAELKNHMLTCKKCWGKLQNG
jgi:hypothetical protein